MLGVGGGGADGAAPAAEAQQSDCSGAVHFGEEDVSGGGGGGAAGGGDRISAGSGNRWPRQETIALLKIRSDMDSSFRDSSHKAPLWEEVSRKMAELGYHRSSKKCKEKFENVYKYHKRTKDGRATKSDATGGKSYRFFDQLEAFENNTAPTAPQLPQLPQPPVAAMQKENNIDPVINASAFLPHQNDFTGSPLWGTTSSSSTSSDEGRRRKRRKEVLEKVMRSVIEKQEEMQKKFLEAIEKRELERVAREEAWRAQEMARINRERELLVQERSMAAAKDAAVIKFLQFIADQHNIPIPTTVLNPEPPPPPPAVAPVPISAAPPATITTTVTTTAATNNNNFGVDNIIVTAASMSSSSSRWPKTEIEALIKIRTNMDSKYQENGPKGPLWEEVSLEMAKLGYSRSAKRCKEKWENINKYFKKMKESNKKRPEDSKTCPYFHQLEALYKEKAKNEARPEFAPIMARPEQQWPPATAVSGHNEGEDEETDDDNDSGGGYDVLPTPAPPPAAAPAAAE